MMSDNIEHTNSEDATPPANEDEAANSQGEHRSSSKDADQSDQKKQEQTVQPERTVEIVGDERSSLASLPRVQRDADQQGDATSNIASAITSLSQPARQRDDLSDAAAIADDDNATPDEEAALRMNHDWDNEMSISAVAVELRRIETKIRRLMEDRDPKRRRKLAGTRRWLELEEDLCNLRFSARIPDDHLQEVLLLVSKRHHIFRRLRFLATTRPTWNS